jgi:hypothetical protein
MPPAVKQRLVPRIVGGTDLMAALRQSIAVTEREEKAKPKAKAPSTAAAAPKSKKAAKRNSDQRQMLLPIAGGGKASAVAAKKTDKAARDRPATARKYRR